MRTLFESYFPKVEKLEKKDGRGPYQEIVEWFIANDEFHLGDQLSDDEFVSRLDSIEPLQKLLRRYHPDMPETDRYFLKEIVLWGLVESKKLSKARTGDDTLFSDPYGDYLKNVQ